MDSVQWTQEGGGTKEGMADIAAPSASSGTVTSERKVRPQKEQALNCPRCHSTNTKFCYYNNYSLAQPRYLCKTCRRYWTQGGTLRNVPVGGGSRKNTNRKPSASASPSLSISTAPAVASHPDLKSSSISQLSSQNPRIHHLNRGFRGPRDYHHGTLQFREFPKIEDREVANSSSSANSSSTAPLSALNFLANGIAARGLTSLIPVVPSTIDQTNPLFESGFPFQECKPTLDFSINGINVSRYGNSNHVLRENIDGSLMFTLGEPKRNPSR